MNRALLLDPANPLVLSLCSEAALYSAGDIDHAAALLERALQRDPNDANGRRCSAISAGWSATTRASGSG